MIADSLPAMTSVVGDAAATAIPAWVPLNVEALRVGGSQRLNARGFGGVEGVDAVVAGHKCVTGRQVRQAVAAGKVNGADVFGGRVAEGIAGGDREGAGHAGQAAGDEKPVTVNFMGVAAAATAMPVCVPVSNALAGSLAVKDCMATVFKVALKFGSAIVGGDKGVIGRQVRLAVAAGEVHRPGVTGGGVAEGISRVTVKLLGSPRWWSKGTRPPKVAGGGRGDGDAGLRAGDAAGHGVGRGERLRAGGLERGAEGVHAVVAGDERVVGRQGRPARRCW